MQATNGNFYGTTFIAGTYGYGTVYSFSPGLGAFVETRPGSGKVGAASNHSILNKEITAADASGMGGTIDHGPRDGMETVGKSCRVDIEVPDRPVGVVIPGNNV